MVEICALASGSNGNCYYIGNENEAILVDVGIYFSQLNERLLNAGLDKNKIKAIFISHEHSDHIKGLKVISKKLNIPGFLTKKTYDKASDRYKPDLCTFFEAGETCTIGEINIHSFSKSHDAKDPCSFRVELDDKNIGIFTDIGEPDEIVNKEFSKCDAVFLESNYNKEILWNGKYPYFLKQRIDSSIGHLSNEQAFELTKQFASLKLKTILLSHISESNNNIDSIKQTFSELNGKYNIKISSRFGISEVLNL
ncbi:MAG: MBL fold metallo-hydrolase [Bacteroidales bacterium]|jgi:phosphoribosyl 1,2-cyclic phosphodiesterase|nr:MBL fold metallo-hydrolase [Bacteroidales bacterium]